MSTKHYLYYVRMYVNIFKGKDKITDYMIVLIIVSILCYCIVSSSLNSGY